MLHHHKHQGTKLKLATVLQVKTLDFFSFDVLLAACG